jgi:hypothetical protein
VVEAYPLGVIVDRSAPSTARPAAAAPTKPEA